MAYCKKVVYRPTLFSRCSPVEHQNRLAGKSKLLVVWQQTNFRLLSDICPKPYLENWIFPYPHRQRMAFDDRREKLTTQNMWQELRQSSQLIDCPERDLIGSRGLLCCQRSKNGRKNSFRGVQRKMKNLLESSTLMKDYHAFKGMPSFTMYTNPVGQRDPAQYFAAMKWSLNIKQARKHFISFKSFHDKIEEESKIYVQKYFS